MAHSFPPSKARAAAFATFAAGAPVGGAFGTLIGGVLTQLTAKSWRSSFYLSTGLTALCLIGGLLTFDADHIPPDVDRRVDWTGAVLVTVGLVLIVFVLGQGQIAPEGWRTPYIIALLVIGIVFVALFLVWEHYLEKAMDDPTRPKSRWTPPPLMRLSLWARAKGRMSVILAIAFLNWSGFLSWNFWVQLFYQNYLELTPVKTMVRFIPMFITGILCNFFVALVVGKLSLVVFAVVGTLFTASAGILFALIEPNKTYWAFGFPSTVFSVFGADFVYSAGTIFIAKIAMPHEQSVAGALFQTMTQLGTAFGLTVTTIVFDGVVKQQAADLGITVNAAGSNAPQSAQLSGYRASQWTAAAFCLLAALLGAIFLRGVGIVGHRKHENSSEETMTNEPKDIANDRNSASSSPRTLPTSTTLAELRSHDKAKSTLNSGTIGGSSALPTSTTLAAGSSLQDIGKEQRM